MKFYINNQEQKQIELILFPVNLSAYVGNTLVINDMQRVSVLDKKDVSISLSENKKKLIVKLNGTKLDKRDKIKFAKNIGYKGLKDFYEDYIKELLEGDKEEMRFVAVYLD